MEDIGNYTEDQLQALAYRVLQQIAKSMSLPSNVKKVYLVQLIYAKTHKTSEEVANIVNIVKYERQFMNARSSKKKGRKKMQEQAMEVSSTNDAEMSPPIDTTPKRSTRQYSPEMPKSRPIARHHPKRTISPINKSDRVLRSYNTNSYKRPNYSLINNPLIEMVTAEAKDNQIEKATQINICSHRRKQEHHPNMMVRCVVKKYIPPQSLVSSSSHGRVDNSTGSQPHSQSTKALDPAKRKLTPSAPIYYLDVPDFPKLTYEYAPSYGFMHKDGKISKINALVQRSGPKNKYEYDVDKSVPRNTWEEHLAPKPVYHVEKSVLKPTYREQKSVQNYGPRKSKSLAKITSTGGKSLPNFTYNEYPYTFVEIPPDRRLSYSLETPVRKISHNPENYQTPCIESGYRNVDVTVQDIINSNVDAQTATTSNPEYVLPDSSPLDDPNLPLSDVMPTPRTVENRMSSFSSHYHKAVRAQRLRSTRLPSVRSAFSQIYVPRDVTQPLYIDTGDTTSTTTYPEPNYPVDASILESLYNLPNSAVATEPPLGQLVTTNATTCTFSTPTITTPVQQGMAHSDASLAPQSSYQEPYRTTSEEVSQVSELVTHEQDMTLRRYHEVLSTASPRPADVDNQEQNIEGILEMMEDALEIISTDGNYMERIGMHTRMQCVLCSWAGPKLFLENHIRKEHASQIIGQDKDDWVITYKLGALVKQDVWLSSVCERDGDLYALSARLEDPDCVRASISSLSSYASYEAPKLATITIYNKITGEPYFWRDFIPELSDKMPHQNDSNHLKIQLSKLELLPYRANLKLHNGSLMLNSPSKVLSPELNDIHIMIFVQIQNVNRTAEGFRASEQYGE